MRLIIQRVSKAEVSVAGKNVGSINDGLLILLGISAHDTGDEIPVLVEKVKNLRIFEDESGKMNLSALDVKADVLVVSQFTLYADCKKGRRPSFTNAAKPGEAKALYENFVSEFRKTGLKTETGEFQAIMDVSLVNKGPVTIILDSAEL